jgi:hypothetical protein
MLIEDIITRAGIATYITKLVSEIPVNNTTEIPLPKQIPQQIGLIYGLFLYADTVALSKNPLITSADAQNLYLVLKDGPTEFFETVRLDDLLNTMVGVPLTRNEMHYKCNIPGNFDLSASFYQNPSGIVSAAAPAPPTVISLGVKFISSNSVAYLVEQKYLDASCMTFIKGKR